MTKDEQEILALYLGLKANPLDWWVGEVSSYPSPNAKDNLGDNTPYRDASGTWHNLEKAAKDAGVTLADAKAAFEEEETKYAKIGIADKQIDWRQPPELEDFEKYEDTEGGLIRAYNEYIIALSQFARGPQREDFNTQEEFDEAVYSFLYVSKRRARTPQSEKAFGVYSSKKVYRDEIEDIQKKLDKRIKKNEGEYDSYLAVENQQEEQAKAAEVAKAEAEARDTALENFAVPFGEYIPFSGGNPFKISLLTESEWGNKWTEKTLKEKEAFKSSLTASFPDDSEEAATLRALPMETINEIWNQYGRYLSETYRKDKKYINFEDETVASEYAKTWYDTNLGVPKVQKEQAFAEAVEQLNRFYVANGLPSTTEQINLMAEKISKGESSLAAETKRITDTVLSEMYPKWKDYFSAGYTVRDMADSYISKMGQILDLDPTQIGVDDPLIARAIQNKTADGSFSPKTLSEFELDLRKDPRWEQSTNGRETISGIANFVLQKFGIRA